MKRRTFIKHSTFTAFSIATFGAIHWNGKIFEGDEDYTVGFLVGRSKRFRIT
jgi:hypothetical protein